MNKKLDIILRTCSKVNCFSGRDRDLITDKKELILGCLRSLVNSTRNLDWTLITTKFIIIDDHSDDDTLDQINKIVSWKFHHNDYKIISIDKTGNGESLKACYEYANEHCDDLIYFVEDDYLHHPNAIPYMVDFYNQDTYQSVLHPTDYPDRYNRAYPSYIIRGRDCHWRTIKHTTCTFMITKGILVEHWDKYMGFTRYGLDPGVTEDTTINKIYEDISCFSPLPSLALHLQYIETLSPFVDWKNWWTNYGCPIKTTV